MSGFFSSLLAVRLSLAHCLYGHVGQYNRLLVTAKAGEATVARKILSFKADPLEDLFQTLSPIAASLTGLETKIVSFVVSPQCCSRAKIEKSSNPLVLYHEKEGPSWKVNQYSWQ